MFDLDKLINEAYGEDTLSFEKLTEMVENIVVLQESFGILGEEALSAAVQDATEEAKSSLPPEWYKLLPKLEISERWGMADTNDNTARQQFETYMSAIGGNTVKEKLNNIVTFVNNKAKVTDTRKVLSNIIFLDLLSTVVNNFSPSGAGFLFEAFLAGLLGGTQMIGKTEEGVLDIDDLVDAEGRPISLKLLTPSTPIKGSIKNLLSFLAHSEKADQIGGGIIYLCVYKYGKDKSQALGFHEFKITGENVYYWLSDELGFKTVLSEKITYDPEKAVFGGIPQLQPIPSDRETTQADLDRREKETQEQYKKLMAFQKQNDLKIRTSYGSISNEESPIKPIGFPTTKQMTGVIELVKDKFNAVGQPNLKVLKDKIEALGVTIPDEVEIDRTDFSNLSDDEIQNIWIARRGLRKKANQSGSKAAKADYKASEFDMMKAAFFGDKLPGAFAKFGPAPILQPAIDILTSPAAEDGLQIMRDVAKEYKYSAIGDSLESKTEEELKALGVDGINKLRAARKKIRDDLRAGARSDNPYMGYFKNTFSKAVATNIDTGPGAEQSIEQLQTMFRDSAPKSDGRQQWLDAMMGRYIRGAARSAAATKEKKVTSESLILESKESQFEINSALITKNKLPAIYEHERLGVLKIDEDSIRQLATSYAEDVLRDIARIFVALDKVTKGITNYFLAGTDRVTSADNAVDGLSDLQQEVSDQMKSLPAQDTDIQTSE